MSRRPGLAPIVLPFLLAAVAVCAQGTSAWVFFGPDNRLSYATDGQGNRIMDFSSAGYKGGGVSRTPATVRPTFPCAARSCCWLAVPSRAGATRGPQSRIPG